ncbi:hypothetical protein [Catellatospora sp. NPDC049609]|uniref:hypothetical protein n=1 Tax=Catellatospora sp. NPDC049609 TaxID=3155505 RepID=UPI0034172E7C
MVELTATELGFDDEAIIEVQFHGDPAGSAGVALQAARGTLHGLRASTRQLSLLVRQRGEVREIPAAVMYSINFPYIPDGVRRLRVACEQVMATLVDRARHGS